MNNGCKHANAAPNRLEGCHIIRGKFSSLSIFRFRIYSTTRTVFASEFMAKRQELLEHNNDARNYRHNWPLYNVLVHTCNQYRIAVNSSKAILIFFFIFPSSEIVCHCLCVVVSVYDSFVPSHRTHVAHFDSECICLSIHTRMIYKRAAHTSSASARSTDKCCLFVYLPRTKPTVAMTFFFFFLLLCALRC